MITIHIFHCTTILSQIAVYIVAQLHGDIHSFHNTNLSVVENSAYMNCAVLLVSGSMSLEGRIAVLNNTATKNSKIVIIKHPTMNNYPSSLYYNSLFEHKEVPGEHDRIKRLIYQNATETEAIYIEHEFAVGTTLNIDIPQMDTISYANPIVSSFVHKGNLIFHGNMLTEESVGLMSSDYDINNNEGIMLIEENECETSSYLMLLNNTVLILEGSSTFQITHNKVNKDSSILLSVGSIWTVVDSQLVLTDNSVENGFSLLFFSTTFVTSGPVIVSNNNISDFGALNFISSTARFLSTLEVKGNRAESGGISADHSDIYFMRNTTFSDNKAANGGGISLISSVMHVSPNATVVFSRNNAERLGGAIFISEPKTTFICDFPTATVSSCAIQVIPEESSNTCGLFSVVFNGNRAGIAGNAIYGGTTSACIPSKRDNFCSLCPFPDVSDIFQYNGVNDSSDLSDFTSDPTRVCFCQNGLPNCYEVLTKIAVHPGENFNLSLAVVGYGLGTVTGSVIARSNNMTRRVSGESLFGSELQYSQEIGGRDCQNVEYSIVSERDREFISLAVDTNSFVRSFKEVQAVVHFQTTRNTSSLLRSPYNSVFENFFHIPVFVDINLLPCPQLNLLLLTLSSSALLALTTALRPYKNRLLNGLEIFHLAILLIFSSSNLYVSSFVTTTEVHAGVYVVLVATCFLVFLGVCVGHIWYRIRRVQLQVKQAPQEREMEEHGRQWYRAKVGNQEEDMEGVTISTGGTTNSTSDGGRRDSVFRESVLELGTD